ncbi:MAG TPA: hypothetical protein VGS08_04155 [Candidatus Saccharimonadales bacterium]|nr:hypothetical protein [Candidatus Saccharimonadales bacterium]
MNDVKKPKTKTPVTASKDNPDDNNKAGRLVIHHRPMVTRTADNAAPATPAGPPSAPPLTSLGHIVKPLATSKQSESTTEAPATDKPTQQATVPAEPEHTEAPEQRPPAAPATETPVDQPTETLPAQPQPPTDDNAAPQEQKLLEDINSRQYFLPINTVARKRSIKVSLLLTLLVLLLSVVLIDLMLDTGIILLLEKVPHTHFFTTINQS